MSTRAPEGWMEMTVLNDNHSPRHAAASAPAAVRYGVPQFQRKKKKTKNRKWKKGKSNI